VFCWGLGADGRLGLGEGLESGAVSHQDPQVNPYFYHSDFDLTKEDGAEEANAGEGGEYDEVGEMQGRAYCSYMLMQ